MKIGSFESKPIPPSQGTERTGPSGSVPAKGAEVAAPSAQVALSPAASLLVKAADDPAFDAAKVERIATAIREGTYQINAEAIADKLIVNAEELLGRKIG